MANQITGNDFKKMLVAGARNLANHSEIVDKLNVFPVPDGDTGKNMMMTFTAGANKVGTSKEKSIGLLTKQLSRELLMGARGNSGVILSQLFRGFATGLEGHEVATIADLAHALDSGVKTAYKAVMKPVEGTILTVARESATATLENYENINNVVEFYEFVVDQMKISLEKTPELLPVLKEAGVIDSGGQGLVYVYEGFLKALKGEEVVLDDKTEGVNVVADFDLESDEFGYCTEFIVRLDTEKAPFNETMFSQKLSDLGDSIVVVQDEDIVKVHIHTLTPGDVLNMAQRHGEFVSLKIENMTQQHSEMVSDAASVTSDTPPSSDTKSTLDDPSTLDAPPTPDAPSTPDVISETPIIPDAPPIPDAPSIPDVPPISNVPPIPDAPSTPDVSSNAGPIPVEIATETPAAANEQKEFGVIAVVSGAGVKALFEESGAHYIIEGGQTMNPSTEDFIKAIEELNAKNIIILPNNSNIIMAARQAKDVAAGSNIVVIPTKTIPQGYASLAMYNEHVTLEQMEADMRSAIAGVKSGALTYAVRDTSMNGVDIKKDDFIGILDKGGIVVSLADQDKAAQTLVLQMLDEDSELVTIIYGEGTTDADAKELAEFVKLRFPATEITIVKGDQPVYSYIIAVE